MVSPRSLRRRPTFSARGNRSCIRNLHGSRDAGRRNLLAPVRPAYDATVCADGENNGKEHCNTEARTMTNSSPGALDGIRVVDLTRILAGPLCTMMLGDMGADVIKIEPPTGDDTRRWGPPFAGDDAAYFLGINRNKRSLTLNMAVPEGQKILAGLIEKADVLIDNFRIGTLEKWGFTDAWFEAHAPRLVRCSITGYGTSGPRAAPARLRLHPAGRIRPDEHLRRARRRADQVRRRDRRRLHRDAGVERHPGGDQCPPSHRQGPEGRAVAVRDLARDADQRRAELPASPAATAAASATAIRASCPTPPTRPPTR